MGTKKKKPLSSLIDRIERLDWGYEMSDDQNFYKVQHAERKSIDAEIAKLDLVLIHKLISRLTPYGMAVWQRYFKVY